MRRTRSTYPAQIFFLSILLISIPLFFISQQYTDIKQHAATVYPNQTDYTSPYGVTTIHADTQLITDFHDLNIHWVRYQIAGIPNFTQLDTAITQLNAAGIHIDFSIHCITGSGCFSNPPLPTTQQMAAAATQIATRYNGQNGHGFIDAYEIGNEEFDFFPTASYPPILQAGCQAVKAASPQALCGMYGTYTPNLAHYTDVINQIFTQNVGQSIDFLNFHYYVHGNDPANPGNGLPTFNAVWQAYHQTAVQHNQPTLPIWVTEVGWPTATVSCCHAVTPQQQVQYLQYVFDQSRTSQAIQHVFWFTLDYGDQGDSLDRTSTGRLPAFTTYQQYVQKYPSWTTQTNPPPTLVPSLITPTLPPTQNLPTPTILPVTPTIFRGVPNPACLGSCPTLTVLPSISPTSTPLPSTSITVQQPSISPSPQLLPSTPPLAKSPHNHHDNLISQLLAIITELINIIRQFLKGKS